jgi:hypothetical protein
MDLISFSKNFLRTNYRYGGTSPSGFDDFDPGHLFHSSLWIFYVFIISRRKGRNNTVYQYLAGIYWSLIIG